MKKPSEMAKIQRVRDSLPREINIDPRLGSQAIDSTGERMIIDTVRKTIPETIDVVDSHGVTHDHVRPWLFRILK